MSRHQWGPTGTNGPRRCTRCGVASTPWTRDECSPSDGPFLRAVRDRLDRGTPRPGHGKVTDEDGHQWAIEGWLALADGTQTWTVRPLDGERAEPTAS